MLRKLCLFVTLLAFCGLVGVTGCSKKEDPPKTPKVEDVKTPETK